jgi:hypothetical protein
VAACFVSFVIEGSYDEWPERESNPRHADFQGVSGRFFQVCPDRLATVQQRLPTGPWSIEHDRELLNTAEFRY